VTHSTFDLRRDKGNLWLEWPADASRDATLQARAASADALARLQEGRGIRAASGVGLSVAERRMERMVMRSSASEPQLWQASEAISGRTPLKRRPTSRFGLQAAATQLASDLDMTTTVALLSSSASASLLQPAKLSLARQSTERLRPDSHGTSPTLSGSVSSAAHTGLPHAFSASPPSPMNRDASSRMRSSQTLASGQAVADRHTMAVLIARPAAAAASRPRVAWGEQAAGSETEAGAADCALEAADCDAETGQTADAQAVGAVEMAPTDAAERALALSMVSSLAWLADAPPAQMRMLCARALILTVKRYTTLCYEGMPRGGPACGACFVLLSGRVRCMSDRFASDSELQPGACFEEAALVGERVAVETALALETSRLMQLRLADLRECMVGVDELQRRWVVRTLQTVPLFRNLNVGRNLTPLSRVMRLARFKAGERITHEGGPADALFILAEGRVVFSRAVASRLGLFRSAIQRVIDERMGRRRRSVVGAEIVYRDTLQEAWEVGLGGVGSADACRNDASIIPTGHALVGQCNACSAEKPWFGELAFRQGRQRWSATATCSEPCKLLVVQSRDFGAFIPACPNMKPLFQLTKRVDATAPVPVRRAAAASVAPTLRTRRGAPLPEDDPYFHTAARFGVTLQATFTVLDPTFANPPPRTHTMVHSSSQRMVKLIEIEGPPPGGGAADSASAGSGRNPLIAPATLSKGEWDRSYDGRLARSPSPTLNSTASPVRPQRVANGDGSPDTAGVPLE
jgi:CRP-like cAMP-binding protein